MTLATLGKILEGYQTSNNYLQNIELSYLQGIPFYNWDKSKDQQQDSFVGLVGFAVKNGITHGFYDYEKDIIDYLERDEPTDPKNKHLYILKSAGLGITTLLLYYIAWKCTTNND